MLLLYIYLVRSVTWNLNGKTDTGKIPFIRSIITAKYDERMYRYCTKKRRYPIDERVLWARSIYARGGEVDREENLSRSTSARALH
jgi:hypothetical protein